MRPFPASLRRSQITRIHNLRNQRETAPAGGANPSGFHPFANPTPVLAGNQRQAGRAPPYGGCASPSGAQCRHKGVLCLPGTMPDWGEMDKRKIR
ncbi:MAG: hypothetical protein LBK61_11060 [Spirochaetaceae bacterium]|nr:hypothetical protein [Spirochaetaceae bacterium]